MGLSPTCRLPSITETIAPLPARRLVLTLLLAVVPACTTGPRTQPESGASTPDAVVATPAVAARPDVDAQFRGTTQQGRFAYAWVSEPDPIPFNSRFSLRVVVTRPDAPGRPLPGATLEANAMMPEHGHGMNTYPEVTRVADGTFRVDGMLFHMPGLWHLVLIVKDGDEYDSALVPITIE
ncbi:MAG: FixH family protein [Planctomycetota bacterium]|jgi:hypothetical protein